MNLMSRLFHFFQLRHWRSRYNKSDLGPDSYLRRIRSLVIGEGMLPNGNILQINYAIRQMPQEGVVIEIGSYGGLSAAVMLYLLQKHQRRNKFFTTDPWIYESYTREGQQTAFIDGSTHITKANYHHYMKSAFMNAMQFLQPHQLPHSFEFTSQEFFKLWNSNKTCDDIFGNRIQLGGPIGFAYIDGDHSLEAATHDFEQVDAHLISGGFILLDDSADYLPFGSAELMKKIRNDKRYRIVSRQPNYLLQKL